MRKMRIRWMMLVLVAVLIVSVGACQKAQDTSDAAVEQADETATEAMQIASTAAGMAGETAANALQVAADAVDEASETAANAVQSADEAVDEAAETAADVAQEAEEAADEVAESAADAAQETEEAVEEAEAVLESAGEMANVIPDTVTIDDCMAKKSAVEFPHAKHVDATECTTCHHTQEMLTAESVGEVATCSSCHLDPADAETPNCTEMSTKKNPFHITCIGCHKEKVAEDPTSPAPTRCDGCHPKVG